MGRDGGRRLEAYENQRLYEPENVVYHSFNLMTLKTVCSHKNWVVPFVICLLLSCQLLATELMFAGAMP
jgi:hypothetical protein